MTRLGLVVGLLVALAVPAASSGRSTIIDCACWSFFSIRPDGRQQVPLVPSHGDVRDISADGTKMIFQPGFAALSVSSTTTFAPNLVIVTPGVNPGAARFSPDGTQIAYLRGRPSAGACWNYQAIDVVGADGQNDHTVVTGCVSSVAWSPDGQQLAYVRGQGPSELVVHDLGTSSERVLARRDHLIQDVAWAPQGDRIAYAAARLRIVRADGTHDVAITHGTRPTWSPDGRRLVYVWWHGGKERLAVIGRDGSLNHVLDPRADTWFRSQPAWSPDGSRIAYSAYDGLDGAIFTANRDGTHRRRLVTGSGDEAFGPLRWRPGSILYTSVHDFGD